MLWSLVYTGTSPARWAGLGPSLGGGRENQQHGSTELSLTFSQRVLTADFCDGCKINDVEAIKSQGLAMQDVSAVCWGRAVATAHAHPTAHPFPR
jgi:hypothetical protein